ncbi:MAG TPA: SDR family oxidoreductase [Saprospiraceae bacterium]|nr:SDR family oxidoreductase [Saprospiraceae bacterium]
MNRIDKILILGGSGLLGSSLVPILKDKGHFIEIHGRTNAAKYNADISDSKEAFNLLESINPAVIVNLISLTDVDHCETHPNEAFLANVHTVENITHWIKQKKPHCHLVHISTDQVYDGTGTHTEEQVTLNNYYAFSKYAGELAAERVESTILRTNFFGYSYCDKRASLTDWLFRSLSNSNSIQVFDDVVFNPLSMRTLSEMIELIIRKKPIGVFNLGAHGGMSKGDFAFAFAEELKFLTNTMTRTSTDKVSFIKTYRPKNMHMDCSKFENLLSVKLPFLKNEIKRVAKEYYEEA